MGFIKDQTELLSILETLRGNKRIVFTNGCFDLLHIGHIRYLQEAQACGDLLVVGVNSDASVRLLKSDERPLQCEIDRAEILAALRFVDYTTIFQEETPLNLIKMIKPAVLVKGGDWQISQIVGSKEVLAYGGAVKSLQFVAGKSTTSIVNKVLKFS